MPEIPLEQLLGKIRACRACVDHLPHGVRPVLRATTTARLLIVGQAPGIRVHRTGIPWNDPSGDRLREWLAIDKEIFYDESRVAVVPMGLCYPGTGKGGDLPPRRECAELWFGDLLPHLREVRLTLLIGQYAQAWYLGRRRGKTLAETVSKWRDFLPAVMPLPHPSPRNRRWLKINSWFEEEVIPATRLAVRKALDGEGTPNPPLSIFEAGESPPGSKRGKAILANTPKSGHKIYGLSPIALDPTRNKG
ncbi:MAG: uracil-DNA glycosylase family protein [Candidatus Sumerlaeia bacterium]|nr:uracil-DNA glycosylase family protein [Candidatus Sumerlaeia bacterium]